MRQLASQQDQPSTCLASGPDRASGARRVADGRAELILELQRTAGNQAVQRLLQTSGGPARLQRAMKFELQTGNIVWRTRGTKSEKLPRKFGPKEIRGGEIDDVPLHKGVKGKAATKKKEGSAVELQSESGGFIEFETPKWFSDWCALKKRLDEAVAMVDAIKASKKVGTTADGHDIVEWPFDVAHLQKSKDFKQGLKPGETLQVEIVDPDWYAGIQSSESFELSQYESFLTEHEWGPWVTDATAKAKEIVTDANTKGIDVAELVNLRSFLQMILDYILNAQNDWKYEKLMASKEYLSLMARTSFSSMYRELLSDPEKALFDRIVKSGAILKKMGLTKRSRFYAHGVRGPLKSLTVNQWLQSIPLAGRKKRAKKKDKSPKDLLSRPAGGSAAMGRFDVNTEPDKDDTLLVKFETRSTQQDRTRKVEEWVPYAEKLFKQAAAARGRAGKSTELTYDPDCDKVSTPAPPRRVYGPEP